MKVVGIITEYNPMHNGHIHHINETKRLSNCDVLVCVMSSNFTQRGEPTILDKFTRTKLAIENGVDLVVELPFIYTVQNANIFAKTSVSILDKLGVEEIYFGSENGSIEELYKIGEVLQSKEYNSLIKEYLNEGFSYPTSADKAMNDVYPNELFSLPNNILGVQYVLAGKEIDSSISFKSITRLNTNYFDEIKQDTNIQSASGIRKAFFNEEDVSKYVPKNVYDELSNSHNVDYNMLTNHLKYIISRSTSQDLKNIFGVTEGLENKFLKLRNFDSIDDFIKQVISKRYTNSKLKRTIAHIVCNTQNDLITDFDIHYIRVLGFNRNGKRVLSSIKHRLEIPLVVKVKEGIHPYLDHELRVSKIYSMLSKKDVYKQEFMPPIL